MLLKMIQSFLTELPKLELGDVSTRATKLQQWKIAVRVAISPAGPIILAWWDWCLQEAEAVYQVFLHASLQVREALVPTSAMPAAWTQLEAWLRPKLLECLPKDIQDWVSSRTRQGILDASHVLIYYAMKRCAPGNADERVHLVGQILNPSVCSQARSAQKELIAWKANLRRCQQLRIAPPDLMLSYRAMASIFSTVFDKAEPQLNLRWLQIQNVWGLPHRITPEGVEAIASFADAELGALVVLGGSGGNTGLPLTDNQRARNDQLKQGEKKRAAAAKLKQEQAAKSGTPDPKATAAQPKAAAAVEPPPPRYTSTISLG